jgi:hypothetical protein
MSLSVVNMENLAAEVWKECLAADAAL